MTAEEAVNKGKRWKWVVVIAANRIRFLSAI
jgi:hypothetical protein